MEMILYQGNIVYRCLSIYMDTINIFIRIATILAGGGGNRRR